MNNWILLISPMLQSWVNQSRLLRAMFSLDFNSLIYYDSLHERNIIETLHAISAAHSATKHYRLSSWLIFWSRIKFKNLNWFTVLLTLGDTKPFSEFHRQKTYVGPHLKKSLNKSSRASKCNILFTYSLQCIFH